MVVFQFSTERSLFSALIRWFTQSQYSHVDVLMPDGRLLGARLKGGVQIRSPNYAKFSQRAFVSINVGSAAEARFYEFLHVQVGKRYDWFAIVAFIIPILAHLRSWQRANWWFCSELGAAALEKALRIVLPTVSVTPNTLYVVASVLRQEL